MWPDALASHREPYGAAMDVRGQRIDTARILGNVALVVGILIAVIGLVTDGTPAKGYFFAGLLVIIGLGLRLEAAVSDRR